MRTENQWLFFGKEESQILVNTVGIENTTDSLREFMETPEKSKYRALAPVKQAVFDDAFSHPDDYDELLASINELVEGFMECHTDSDGEFISDATSQLRVKMISIVDDNDIFSKTFFLDEAVFDYGTVSCKDRGDYGPSWFITNSDGETIVHDGEWLWIR